MSNIESEIVLARLSLIAKYYNTLEQFSNITLDNYLADFNKQLIKAARGDRVVEHKVDRNISNYPQKT